MRMPFKHNLSSTELLRLVRSQEEWAVEDLFLKTERLLRRDLRKHTADYKNAANYFASVAVTTIIEKEVEPVLTCSLTYYAKSIAWNQWLNSKKKNRRVLLGDRFSIDQLVVEEIYEQIEKDERRLLVNLGLREISEKCRSILLLYCHDFTPEEARQEMGYSNPKVYQVKKSECMNKLKAVIIKAPEYNELFEKKKEEPNDE